MNTRIPNVVPSAIAIARLLEPEDEIDVFEGDEPPEEAVPVPPLELGFEPVCVGAGNEVMAGVKPGEGAV